MIAALSRLGRSKITEIRKGGSHWIQPFSCCETVLLGMSFPVLLLEQHLLKFLHPKEKKMQMRQESPASRKLLPRAQSCCPSPPARTPLPRLHSAPVTQDFLLSLRRGPQFGFSHPATGEAHQVSPDSLETC